MAKPDPTLLDPARYPFHCTIGTRFSDLDFNRHLNNVALVGIMEDGRARFHHASGFYTDVGGMNAMVASFSIEYLDQAWYPEPLEMHAAVGQIGRTSFTVQQLIKQEHRIVSFAQSIMVYVVDDRPTALPPSFAQDIAGWMLRP